MSEPNPKILIEVRGGIANVVYVTAPVEVYIIDMDNMAAGDPPALDPVTCMELKSDKEFADALDGIARVYVESFKIV